MRLLTLDDGHGGSLGARLTTGEILHLSCAARGGGLEAWLPRDMPTLLEGGADALSLVEGMIDRAQSASPAQQAALARKGALLPAGARLLPVVPRPRMALATGRAYRDHINEMSGTPAPPNPTAFMKSAITIAAHDDHVQLPPGTSDQVDFEGEVVCVIGRACHRATPEQAWNAIAGLTIANDLSARNWVDDALAATDPWDARNTWEENIRGKQFPGFTPLGPELVTMDEIEDVGSMRLRTRVNGEIMQDALLSSMLHPMQNVISHLSQWYSFQPGDLLLTGTPAGVGFGRNPRLFLKDGDRIDVEVTNLGSLTTFIGPDTAA